MIIHAKAQTFNKYSKKNWVYSQKCDLLAQMESVKEKPNNGFKNCTFDDKSR